MSLGLVLILSVVQLISGLAIGWYLAGRRAPEAPVTPEPAPDTSGDIAQAQLMLDSLQAMASDVATNVGQHSARVEEISASLEDPSASSEMVQKAIAKLLSANAALRTELKDAQEQIQAQANQIEATQKEARTDQLTGVANRRVFDSQLRQRYSEWFRLRTPVSLIMIDIDHFKKFNDTYGHATGDFVLKNVAQALSKTARDIDLVTRYGGEEFGVILPGTTVEQAKVAAERLRKAVENQSLNFEEQDLKVTISLGLAELMGDDTLETLPARADEALYAAKRGGRNCGFFHDGKESFRIEVTVGIPKKEAAPPRDVPAPAAAPAPAAVALQPATDSAVAVLEAPDDVESWVGDESADEPSERRSEARRSLDAKMQPIAPLYRDRLPDVSDFQPVKCLDVSSKGFSFLVKRVPSFEELVVALGIPPAQTYLSARIVYRVALEHQGQRMYRVGCEFTNRLPGAWNPQGH